MPLSKTISMSGNSYGSNSQVASGAQSTISSTTDKSTEAARMARELASQSSWADRYVPATPASTATPPESVADVQSLNDSEEPPPSYEDARLERDLPARPQARQENVRQAPAPPTEAPALAPSTDVESGVRMPLLSCNHDVVKTKRRQQKKFVITFLILALVLIAIQAIKGFGIGFWRADGTPIPPLPQREYTRHENSQSITGTFTFYDKLDLSTSSGTINIEIDPQYSTETGVIRLASRSGTIKVKFSDDYMKGVTASGILDRTFDIEIKTSSGSQNIELPQGNSGVTVLTSESGSITAKFYTVNSGRTSNATTVTTQSASSSQNIKYRQISAEPISTLAAKHYSTGSGTVKVGLPPAWEGMVHASIGGSGNVEVKGDSLQYQRNGNKEIYAWRVHDNGKKDPSIEGQVVEVRCDGSGTVKVDCSSS